MSAYQPVLDPACGGRMFWFDKSDDRVLFGDVRDESWELCDGRRFDVKPDMLMDYRDHADGSDGIIAHARAEIDAAALRGKRVVIGVETADNEIAKVTFFDNTDAQLELALAQTASAYAGHAGFGGFAVHHFESYVEWLAAQ